MFKTAQSTTQLLNSTSITRIKRATAVALAGILTSTAPALAINDNALPTGGSVSSGSATIATIGNQTNIHQSSQRVVIDWSTYNIGKDGTVQYYQPGKNSVAANVVNDVNPSYILGNLRANGKVIILNSNGVFFGQNAHVDVAGLLVSTGKLDNNAFMNDGSVNLSGINSVAGAKIQNDGSITIQEAGLAAFVAPEVVNNGVIQANLGKIALASGGDKATVDLYGDGLVEMQLNDAASKALITNTGTLKADGGTIAITAKAAAGVVNSTINMGGIVEANTVGTKNGKIILGATNADIHVRGKLNAKGGNGEIQVSSDKNIGVYADAELNTDGGNGNIGIIADQSLVFLGHASARGGDESGNGGFVETSGLGSLTIQGTVDTSAPNGATGNWLIDPNNVLIIGGNGDGDDNGGASGAGASGGYQNTGDNGGTLAFTTPTSDGSNPYTIYESEIEAQSVNTNITIQARQNINTQAGVGLDNNVTLAANRNLTIETRNNATDGAGVIDLSNLAFTTTGTGSINVNGSTSGVNTSDVTLGKLTTGAGGVNVNTKKGQIFVNNIITTALGNVNMTATDRIFVDNDIITNGGNATFNATTFTTDDTNVSGSPDNFDRIVTSGGNIKITADNVNLGETIQPGNTTPSAGTILDAGAGDVTITRKTAGVISLGNATNYGLNLNNQELDAIHAATLHIGATAEADNFVTAIAAGNVNTTSNIAGAVTLTNLLNQDDGIAYHVLGGSAGVDENDVIFSGNNTFNALTVNANDHITTLQNSTVKSVTGDINFNSDANGQGVGGMFLGYASTVDTNGKNFTFNGHQAEIGSNASINAKGGNIKLINDDVFKAFTPDSLITSGTGKIELNQYAKTFTDTNPAGWSAIGSINNAANAILNTGTGQNTVNAKAGIYDETVQLIGQDNLHIKGDGQGLTIIKPTSIASAPTLQHPGYFGSQNYQAIVLAKDANNVDLTGMTIDGSLLTGGAGSTNPGYAGISYYNASGDVGTGGVTNTAAPVKIIGGGNLTFGILSTADAASLGQSTARTVNITGVTSSGAWWAALASIGDLVTVNVDGGTFDGTGGAAALDLSNGSKGTVKNATITTGNQYGENAGIVFHGGHDWTLTNNTITGQGTDSIGILDHGVAHGVLAANNINIIGGTISNVGTGIEAVGGGTNWDVNGTTISAASAGVGKGIHFKGLNGGNVNTITDVTVSNFDKGIHNDGSNGTLIKGGTFTNNTTGTLVNPSTGVIIDGATYTGGTNGVVFSGGDNNTVKNSKVNNTVGDGIVVSGSTNAKITSNKIGTLGGANSIGSGAGGGDAIFVTDGDGVIIKGNETANTHYNGPARKGSGILVVRTDNAVIGGTGTISGMPGVSEANIINLAGSDGIVIRTDGDTANNNKIVGNKIVGIAGSRTGIYTEYATNTLIDQNNVSGTGRYAAIYANGGSDATITTNTINHNDEEGIRLENSTGTNKIAGNKIDNTGEHLKTSDGTNSGDAIHVVNATNLTVSGNKIGQNGGGINGDGIFVDPSNVAQLFDNVISNAAGNGIWSLNNDDANIYHNTIDKVTGNGILVQGGNNVTVGGNTAAKGNKITNAGLNGIFVDQTGHSTFKSTVQNNSISVVGTTGAYDGILLLSGTGSLIDSNKIKGSDGATLGTASGKAGATRDGIHVEGNNTVVISNNTVTGGNGGTVLGAGPAGIGGVGAVNDGIYVKGSNFADINHNTISGGLTTLSGTIPFLGSFTGGNGGNGVNNNGIEVSGGTDASIDTNTVIGGLLGGTQGAHNDGIHVDTNQQAKITNNKIIGNVALAGAEGAGHDGIWVNKGGANGTNNKNGVVVTGNTVLGLVSNGAGNDGIHVVNSASKGSGAAALIEKNSITYVGHDGIFASLTKGVNVLTNTVTKTGDDGIEVDDSDNAQVKLNNTVTLAGDVGILIDPSSNTVTDGNTVTLSGSYGVQVDGGANNMVSNNTITLSGNDGVRIDKNTLSTVYHNTISLSQGDGVEVNSGLFGSALLGGNTVDDNTISLSLAGHGVNFHDSAFGKVTNNTITLSKLDGINANKADGLKVDHNTVSLSGDDGIEVTNSKLVGITYNTVSLSADDGITTTTVDALDISHNDVSLSITGDGIDVNGANIFDINNNTVSLSFDNGIELSDGNIGSVNDNTVSLSGNDGINANTLNVVSINGNTVTGSVDDGIDVDGALISSINGNHILLSLTGNGIEASDFNIGSIDGNDVTATLLGNGIDLRNSNLVEINTNTVALSGQNGIYVDPSFLISIDHNIVAGALLDGIHAEDVGGLFITNNFVTLTGDDGIDVRDSVGVLIGGNTTLLTLGDGIQARNTLGLAITGNNVFLAGDDGIDVEHSALAAVSNNTVVGVINNGIEVSDAAGVLISGNTVALAGHDGINVDNTIGTLIVANNVALVGHNGISLSDSALSLIAGNNVIGALHDGISLDGTIATLVAGNNVALVGHDGISESYGIGSIVAGNTVFGALHDGISLDHTIGTVVALNGVALVGHDGISVEDSALSVIAGNIVVGALHDGISLDHTIGTLVAANNIAFVGNDGISIDDSALSLVTFNNIGFAGGDGVDVDHSAYVGVVGNTVDFVLDNGVEVGNNSHDILVGGNAIGQNGFVGGNGVDIEDSHDVLVAYNGIYSHVQGDGIFIDPSFNVDIVNNIVDKVGGIGIHVAGPNNGLITLAGNTVNSLAGNTGARFESGQIDLTGATNTFNGGANGLEFDGTQVSLVGDTIGTTAFNGQSQYYVQLSNGALFNPGHPTHIDGYHATFDGLTAAAMTPGQFMVLQSKIYDYNDDNTLGLFFPNLTGLNQNDLLPKEKLSQFNAKFGGSVTILGLPLAKLGAIGTGVFGNLANIAPAAGGGEPGDNEQASAFDLNAIDSAAGSATVNTWDSVYSHLGGHAGPVTYNLELSPAAAIAQGI